MLKRSQKINNYLIKQLPKATVFVNRRKVIVFVSDKWLNDFDLGSSEVIGKNIVSLFNNSNPEWQNAVSECLNGLPNLTLTESHLDPNGNKKCFELHSTHWHDENENVIGTILQVEDITLRVLTENKLEKLEIISENISDMAEIGFWEYNLVEDQVLWDNRIRAIHEVPEDYEPNIIDYINFFKNGHSRNRFSMTLNKAMANQTPYREKLQIITAKGHEKWIINSGKPCFEKGEFIGFTGTVQDINERFLAELKQTENEGLLRTLIDNLPLNVFIKDLNSRKLLVNKSEIEFSGAKSEEEILGKDNFDLFDEKTAEESRKDDLTVMRDGKTIHLRETNHIKKDGSQCTLLISKIPLKNREGKIHGLIGISLDISDRKKKELELRNLIKVTSSQNEKLISFAHIVSHNLRSHTSNFSMLLNFLEDQITEDERKHIMSMLVKSSDNLLETIGTLNEVVDINTKNGLIRKTFSLKTKINNILESLSADLLTHNVTINNRVRANIKIKAIPAYLDSILNNFLTNAIKYRSTKRTPDISLHTEKEDEYTVLFITDNGLGIDLEKHGSKLFGMYKTFHNHKDSKGIGLYISKNQIEAMNGKVTVESKVDEGTTFKIYFNDKD